MSKNETHKIHWEFKIQTDHQIPARRPELALNNKNMNVSSGGCWHSCRPQGKNKRKRKERKTSGSCQRAKKSKEHDTVIPIIKKKYLKNWRNLKSEKGWRPPEANTLLKSARILWNVLLTWGDLLSLNHPSKRHPVNAGIKKLDNDNKCL